MRLSTTSTVFLALACPQPALAQTVVPKTEALITSQTRTASIDVADAGEIRLRLPRAPADGWSLAVTIDGKDVQVTPATLKLYRVYGDTIELPVRSSGDVRLAATGNLEDVVLESLVLRPQGKALFPQGGLLERMVPAFRADPANATLVDRSNAVVRVRWSSPSYPTRWCTGVQYEPGRVLTNRHCLPTDYNVAAPTGEIAVLFGNFAGTLDDPSAEQIPAWVHYLPAGTSTNGAYQRDMALVRLQAQPQNAVFRNAVVPIAATVAADRQLNLVTIWSYDKPAGKAVSRDKICRADIAQQAKWWCFASTGFWHRCEAEEGSSGSPIIDQVSGELVGLHYSGVALNGGNCALRADVIRQELAFSPN